MATLTVAALKALDLGYLTGDDLCIWAAPQMLIKQYESDNDVFTKGVKFAIAHVSSKLESRYDMAGEYAKTGVARATKCIQITAISAVMTILANMANIGEQQHNIFKWNEKVIQDFRGGQDHLPIPPPPIQNPGTDGAYTPVSLPQIVGQSFSTLG